MNISAQGLALIKISEGFRGRVYLDVAGLPTVGYGHKLNLAAHEAFPNGVTEEQASTMLAADVAAAEQAVTRLVHVELTQGQFDALVDFCFNLGAGRLAGSTLLKELNAGNYHAASLEFLKWDHAGLVELPALKARRQAEFKLFTGASE